MVKRKDDFLKRISRGKQFFNILIPFLYIVMSTCALVLYGPFENLRKTVIGAVLTSSHPWVIKPFYSAATLKKYEPISLDTMSQGTMHTRDFSAIHSNEIEVIPIQGQRYSGSLLVIHDPSLVHIASTKHLNFVGETVSEMVKDVHAIAGINAGGFYDGAGHGTGGVPIGLTISRGQYVCGDQTAEQPVIGLTQEGSMVIGKYTYQELMQLHVRDAISYGPQLVQDGKSFLKPSDDSWGIAPRSAIGQRSDGAILMLSLSGRGSNGIGASLLDCADVMLENGAYVAANLDGGYSSELYYNGKFLVPPSNPLGERYVATSFLVDGGQP